MNNLAYIMQGSKLKKKPYLILFLKIAIFTAILLIVYYFAILKPRLEIPNALLDAERNLSKHYYTLIENRLAYTELTRLDTTSGNFEFEKGEIIAKIKKTNEEGLKNLENPLKLKIVKGAPNETLNFLNEGLPKAYSTLLEKNKKVYLEQKSIIEDLNSFDSKVSKLFAYSPEADLGNLDPVKEKDEMLTRITNAKQGLNKIKDEVLKSDQNNEEVVNLSKEIETAIGLLTQLEDNLKKGTIRKTQNIKNSFNNQFRKIKSSAFEAELSIIKSPESVKLLTDQTNLIFEYEFWISKIRGLRN